MTALHPQTDRTPHILSLLIAAQLFCSGFFLFDLVQDFAGAGSAFISETHLYVEALAVVVLLLSAFFEARYVLRLVRRKAHLETSLSLASAAVQDVIDAHFEAWGLSPAEQDVATFLVKGLSTAEIAGIRGNAEGTVKAHLHNIYRKSGTRNRAEVLSVVIDSLIGVEVGDGPREPLSGAR